MKDNEAFYDEHLAPKLQEVIRLCTEADLPFFAQFQLTGPDEATGAGPMFVSMGNNGSEANHSERMTELLRCYGPGGSGPTDALLKEFLTRIVRRQEG